MEIIKNFYSQYKIIANILIVIFLLGLIFFAINSIYSRGYESGFNDSILELNKSYELALENKLKSQKESLEQSFKVILDNKGEKIKTETVYVDRIKTVEKIVEKSVLKECIIPKNEIDYLNELTRKPK